MSGTSQWPMSELKIARSARAERVAAPVEGQRVHRVVGLAAEEELPREELAHVLGGVDRPSAANSSSSRRRLVRIDVQQRRPERVVRVAPRSRAARRYSSKSSRSSGAVDAARVVAARRVRALRFSKWPIEVGVEVDRPADAALEEREAKLGEAARDAAENERAADRLAGRREVADVVVHVVDGRAAAAPAHAARVEGRRDAELDAARQTGS